MKQEILDRIKELGGNIDRVKGYSLQDDLLSISFDANLSESRKYDESDIWELVFVWNIDSFIKLDYRDETEFVIIAERFKPYYDGIIRRIEDSRDTISWAAKLFTPYEEGSEDFKDWNTYFTDDEKLKAIREIIDDPQPAFIHLFYDRSCNNYYLICLSDPNPENPTVFKFPLDFCNEVVNEGNLEDFLCRWISNNDIVELVKEALVKFFSMLDRDEVLRHCQSPAHRGIW